MNKTTTEKCLQGLSNLLHPLFMLTYAAVIVFSCTYLVILPQNIKWLIIAEVFFFSCIVPVLCIALLYKLKVVGHWALRNRTDRALPLLINVISYALCAWFLFTQGLPMWVMAFYIGATAVAFICWIISFWWKISAHAAGIAGLATVLLLMHTRFPESLPLALPLTLIVLTGLLCSIRVYLGRHTLAQVGAGSLTGVVVIATFYLLLA